MLVEDFRLHAILDKALRGIQNSKNILKDGRPSKTSSTRRQ